ncbi:MAG TPA: hydantoinase/oxoprolinase family protein [Acidimicrobiales bacterium]|nr:hydantoinase/oxoprolinase family protein [Acidimicrobiales bacterium]
MGEQSAGSEGAGRLLGVDVGGTFTDVVSVVDGRIEVAKVPTRPESVEESVLEGARVLHVDEASLFNHASTHGLNAFLTRRLPKVAFLTTEGHRDMLDMGLVMRPLNAVADARWRRNFSDAMFPLVPRYLRRGISERMMATGEVHSPLDREQAIAQLRVLARCHVDGVAICLLHGYTNNEHEVALRELVRQELGDVSCSISSEVSPLIKEYARATTTVADVVMKLVYNEYIDRLDKGLSGLGFSGQLNFADSAATLVAAEHAKEEPFRLAIGGPAAGTTASAHLGRFIDEQDLICIDVGGTSCDLSLVTGGQPYVNSTFQLEWDMAINSPSTEITTLGAGGGSVVAINELGEVTVGPESAGADPGPACYGRGGTQPAVTDAAIMIGILDADRFLGGEMQLQPELSKAAFEALDTGLSLEDRVRSAWLVCLTNIAEGLFSVAMRRGVDPRDYSLMAFGAAGPMLLPSLLDVAHVQRVIVPPYPGLFSALGLLSADQVYSASRSRTTVLDDDAVEEVASTLAEMEESLLGRFAGDTGDAQIVRRFDGKLIGQSWNTPLVPIPDGPVTAATIAQMVANFHDEYENRNGNRFEALPVQVATLRVQIVIPSPKVAYPPIATRADGETLTPFNTKTLRYLGIDDVPCHEYSRDDLRAGDELDGPAIISEGLSTTFVPANHSLQVGTYGELIIT